jgi:hypothetical protein
MDGASRVTPHGLTQLLYAAGIGLKYMQSAIGEDLEKLSAVLTVMSTNF